MKAKLKRLNNLSRKEKKKLLWESKIYSGLVSSDTFAEPKKRLASEIKKKIMAFAIHFLGTMFFSCLILGALWLLGYRF